MTFISRDYSLRARLSALNCGLFSSLDKVALITFAETAETLCPFVSPGDPLVRVAIQGLSKKSGYATNLSGALRLGNDMLEAMPKSLRRTMWVLTDGVDNVFTPEVFPEARRANVLDVALNTIGFGEAENFDEYRLMAIANMSAGGKYVPVSTARSLEMLFSGHLSGEAEATVYCVDVSNSMIEPMGERSKMQVVQDTLLDLMRWNRV